MKERVVEDEEFFILPVMLDGTDLDVGVLTDVFVQAVEDTKRWAEWAEMTRGAFAFSENGDADGADELVLLMKCRDVDRCFDVLAVPFEKVHRPWQALGFFVDQRGKANLVGFFQKAADLFLICFWKIFEFVNAFIYVRQREDIHQDIYWRRQPCADAVAHEVLTNDSRVQTAVAGNVPHAAEQQNDHRDRQKIKQREKRSADENVLSGLFYGSIHCKILPQINADDADQKKLNAYEIGLTQTSFSRYRKLLA